MWFIGPINTENPNITNKLPRLNDKANLDGRIASSGRVRNATKKHIAAPIKQPPKPSSLSHLDKANQASSSFERSFDRSGT